MILIIDNYDSFTYNLYQFIAKIHPDVLVVRNDKMTVNEIDTLKPSGIVLSPGPGRPENAGICVDLIQKLDKSIPLLGVCLGHQAIAVAFGGNVVSANEIFHGKSDLVFHHRKGLYETMPLPFTAGRYHSLMVERSSLPDSLMIEAENSNGLIMGFRHRDYPIYGIQFHPESLLTPTGEHFLQQFVERCERKGL